MTDVAHLLLGATLVAIGVLAAAVADRIRGVRMVREGFARREGPSRPLATLQPPVPAVGEPLAIIEPRTPSASKAERAKPARFEPKVQAARGAEDVIVALAAAGYKKPTATAAALGCSAAERTSIEEWTRAALRRCAQGGPS